MSNNHQLVCFSISGNPAVRGRQEFCFCVIFELCLVLSPIHHFSVCLNHRVIACPFEKCGGACSFTHLLNSSLSARSSVFTLSILKICFSSCLAFNTRQNPGQISKP